MDVAALNALSGSTGGKTAESAASIAKTFDNFLTLLTTQLKNQDPLSPMESAEFTNQLVLFSQVEQQINMNSKLDDMLAFQKSNELLSAASYLDKEVEASSTMLSLNAPAEFTYTLPSAAKTMNVKIVDGSGTEIRSLDVAAGDKTKGEHTMTWNGRNNAGVLMPVGSYKLQITAADESSTAISVDVPTDRVQLIEPSNPRFAYAFSEAPFKAEIKILDKDGVAIRTMTGDPSTGRHELTWDGKDASGNRVAAGEYKVQIKAFTEAGAEAKNTSGEAIEAAISTVNRVRDVSNSSDGALLKIGRETYVTLADVIAIRG
ncbi:FlgD immunoglobulin-like domain containing protein [Lacibacterium aquatile]|uniref:Basal-body rod modification protein FlgD n=1 Tax=Lacibacterium aquatile TaxID=1168082 RepID=A0ABW5DQH4_9PROT